MAGPRKLWKTTTVIWTEYDPTKVTPGRLVAEAETGRAYMAVCHSELISSPYMQDDGPPEDFFDSGGSDARAGN